jgi:hypothetical protein
VTRPGADRYFIRDGALSGQVPIAPATVGSDDTFEISGILPGVYELNATLPGRPEWTLKSAVVGGRDVLDHQLDVRSQNVDIGDAVLTFTTRRAELSGILQTPAGAPATDYFIVVFGADRTLWRHGARRLASTRPATDGSFVVRDLPAGEYYLAALVDLDPSDWQTPAFLDLVAPAALRVNLAEGETKVQNLRIAR